MAQFAPELPTTRDLHDRHDIRSAPSDGVASMRRHVARLLSEPGHGLVIAAGPCSLTTEQETMMSESSVLHELQKMDPASAFLQRRNFWKPRSNPEDWHGPETTEPDEVFAKLALGAAAHANGIAEVATIEHIERYGPLLSAAWIGARNNDIGLQKEIAQADKTLPLGYKNAVSGNLEQAVETIHELREARGQDAAPVVLVYRGGEDAKTPKQWAIKARQAVELTNGQVIIDVAHGGEQAHDLQQTFNKTKLGQLACLVHLSHMVADGLTPAGVMMEASDTDSQTDPNMPFMVAMAQNIELLQALRAQ